MSAVDRFQIAAQESRNRDEDYEQTMGIVAALVNLRAIKRMSQRNGVEFQNEMTKDSFRLTRFTPYHATGLLI
jgi:hypothetical protein